mgnify:CR=1 FL=1
MCVCACARAAQLFEIIIIIINSLSFQFIEICRGSNVHVQQPSSSSSFHFSNLYERIYILYATHFRLYDCFVCIAQKFIDYNYY